MSALTIGTVRFHNFGPFADAEIDFNKPGLLLIEGDMLDVFGSDSNGSGKSFLFDGPAWALFGRCIRPKYEGDEVCRLEWKDGKLNKLTSFDGTWVEVEIVGAAHPIRVVRYRKHPVHDNRVILFVDGKDVSRGTNAQTTLAIEQTIGIDFTSFANSVAFGVREDVKSFFTATDAEKKAVLEKILGLELYSEAQKIAAAELRGLAEELNTLDLKRTELQAALVEQRTNLKNLSEAPSTVDVELRVQKQRAKVRRLREVRDAAAAKLEAAVAEAEAERDGAAEEMRVFKGQQDAYLKEKNALQSALREAERNQNNLIGRFGSVRDKRERWKGLGGKDCPTCTQPVTVKLTQAITVTFDKELAEIKAAQKEAETAVAEIKAKLEALEEPIAPPLTALDTAEQVVRQHEERVDELDTTLAAAEEVLESWETNQAEIGNQAGAIEARVKEIEEDLGSAESEWLDANKRAEALQFWSEGFGNSGLKSFLIEAEMPEINKRATRYAQSLLGSGALIKLSATKQLKTKDIKREELGIEVVIPNCTVSYAGASKGQKHRLNLAILLACRDLVGERSTKAFRQFFADELFDGLDKTGCKVVIELLRTVSKECPVALVTHDARIKTVADRVMVVRHVAGVADLLARSAELDMGEGVQKLRKVSGGGTKPKQG